MTANLKTSTKLACRIAGIEPSKLNEAASSGAFHCLPPTTPGKRREFGVVGVIIVCKFADYIGMGMTAAAAGRRACGILRVLREHPNADRVFVVQTSIGEQPDFLLGWDVSKTHADYIKPSPDIRSVEVVHLGILRQRVIEQIKAAQGIGNEG